MPWHTEKEGDRWAIVKDSTGEIVGHSDSEEDANASIRARYAGENMAGGGYVKSDLDPNLLGSLTPSTSEQMAPAERPTVAPQVINQDGKQYNFTPGVNGSTVVANGMPPAGLNIPQPPAVRAKNMRLPGMPDTASIDDLQKYLGRQRAKLGQYGPDAEMALQQGINARRNSLGFKSTEGLKGLADAIMMGVAGAGNPNWQQGFQNLEQQYAQNQQDTLRQARSANLQQLESGMSLDKMDPSSSISRAAQKSYAPLFTKLGYSPDKISGLSAANIESALTLMSQYGGKEMEAMMTAQQLGLQNKQYLEGQRHNQRAEELQAVDDAMEAAKETLKRGRVFGIPVPGFAAPLKNRLSAEKYLASVTEDELPKDGLSPEDQQAMDWANANPADPRSAEIKKRLGQ